MEKRYVKNNTIVSPYKSSDIHKVAMKVIDKKKALQDAYVAKNFKREARLLQKVHHPNIVQLYEVIETENNYYLITELCTGMNIYIYIYIFIFILLNN